MTASELVAVLAVPIFRSGSAFATGCYPVRYWFLGVNRGPPSLGVESVARGGVSHLGGVGLCLRASNQIVVVGGGDE